MRKPYIAGNWKMNLTPSEAVRFAKELVVALKGCDTKVMIAPSFVCLPAVVQAVKGSGIIVAAQNMNDHEKGAFTGEVSALMLKDIGVSTVILGHSERRHIYGETNELINQKVLFAIANGMDVDLCVGETLDERESGNLKKVLSDQVSIALHGVSAQQMRHVTIAYEPVWAIGTGRTATPEDADDAHSFIRSLVEKLYNKTVAEELIIQYGGSVKASNVRALMEKEHVDGALVGGASLSVEQFLPIVTFDK
ncbi:MAG: triose-phosphate isomerase [Sphaerochaetaceae bacterium]